MSCLVRVTLDFSAAVTIFFFVIHSSRCKQVALQAAKASFSYLIVTINFTVIGTCSRIMSHDNREPMALDDYYVHNDDSLSEI